MTDETTPAAMDEADLRLRGIGRDVEEDRCLIFYFDRKPTDEEMGSLHLLFAPSEGENYVK